MLVKHDFPFSEFMLTTPSHPLVLMPGAVFQDELFYHLPRDQSENDWPVVQKTREFNKNELLTKSAD